MTKESQQNQLAPRTGVEVHNFFTLPPKYKRLIDTFRKSCSNVKYYSDNLDIPTLEPYYPEASKMDSFVVFTGEQQPSVSNAEYREILNEILDPETTLAELDFPSVDFKHVIVDSEEWNTLEQHISLRMWLAIKSNVPEEVRDRWLGDEIGMLLCKTDMLNRTINLFRSGRSEHYIEYFDTDDYAKLLKKVTNKGEFRPEDIFFSVEAVSGWNDQKKADGFGTYFSDPEPIIVIKSGEYPFFQLINIIHILHDIGKDCPEVREKLFDKGYHSDHEDIMEQIWKPAKSRLELLHLTEFTDPSLLTMGDMVVKPETGLTLSGAIAIAQELIKSNERFWWEQKSLAKFNEMIADWDNFVMGVDEKRILRLTTSTNPVVQEGASTALVLRSAVATGENWRIDATITNTIMTDFQQKSSNETIASGDLEANDQFGQDKLLAIFREIGIETKQEMLTKDSLSKIIRKLEKHKDLLPVAFTSAVKSGIKASHEVLSEMGIEVGADFYEQICVDPNKLHEVTRQLKRTMMLFHPEAQIRFAGLYSDPEMKKLADSGHIALKNLYHWYETVRKNYSLLIKTI